MEQYNYTCMESVFGDICIFWSEKKTGPKIERILLPSETTNSTDRMNRELKPIHKNSCPQVDAVCERIDLFFQSKPVVFDLSIINLDKCLPFQKEVLLAEYKIPRGYVSTYGRIAKHIGVPKGARAVGNALATNPFPLIIPCHRAVRSDGTLGGFGGGVAMKRALLALEGVRINKNGKIITNNIYY